MRKDISGKRNRARTDILTCCRFRKQQKYLKFQ